MDDILASSMHGSGNAFIAVINVLAKKNRSVQIEGHAHTHIAAIFLAITPTPNVTCNKDAEGDMKSNA